MVRGILGLRLEDSASIVGEGSGCREHLSQMKLWMALELDQSSVSEAVEAFGKNTNKMCIAHEWVTLRPRDTRKVLVWQQDKHYDLLTTKDMYVCFHTSQEFCSPACSPPMQWSTPVCRYGTPGESACYQQ